jgi:hypothetical protein
MKKVIRLTESDLIRLVKRVIKEQYDEEALSSKLKDFHKEMPERRDFEDYASYKEALEDWAETSGYNDHLDNMDEFLLNSKLKDFHKEMPNRGDDIEGWAKKSGYNRHLDKMDDYLTRMRNKKNK